MHIIYIVQLRKLGGWFNQKTYPIPSQRHAYSLGYTVQKKKWMQLAVECDRLGIILIAPWLEEGFYTLMFSLFLKCLGNSILNMFDVTPRTTFGVLVAGRKCFELFPRRP